MMIYNPNIHFNCNLKQYHPTLNIYLCSDYLLPHWALSKIAI